VVAQGTLIVYSKQYTANPDWEDTKSTGIRIISNVVVIFVASIPVAIEVVCTSTLAVGSRRLAQKKVIVSRLSAIEELAGMTILCSDKTGTLTLNQLQLREPKIYNARDAFDIVFHAALASKREKGNQDAIDKVITDAIPREHEAYLHSFAEIEFVPFNPTVSGQGGGGGGCASGMSPCRRGFTHHRWLHGWRERTIAVKRRQPLRRHAVVNPHATPAASTAVSFAATMA
jgi:high-affinity K+ transport system ATPase subunit B